MLQLISIKNKLDRMRNYCITTSFILAVGSVSIFIAREKLRSDFRPSVTFTFKCYYDQTIL